MEEAIEKSIVLEMAGLVNNENICIKFFGSTLVCVCEECREEQFNLLTN